MLRRDPGKQEAWRQRSKPLRRTGIRQRSKRTIREAPIRASVREETILLAGGLCQAQGLGGIRCRPADLYDWEGRWIGDVHEVIQRSLRPGVHLDVDFTLCVCRVHHDEIDRDFDAAHARGLAFRSWQVDEARAAVAAIRAGGAVAGGAA